MSLEYMDTWRKSKWWLCIYPQ